MKSSTSVTRTKIEEILVHWNKNCKEAGLAEQFSIRYEIVDEQFKVEDREGTIRIGKVSLEMMKEMKNEAGEVIDIGAMLLFDRKIPLPMDVKKIKEFNWQEVISKELLYEMLGNFCMTLRGMMYKKIEIDAANKLNSDIQSKIHAEESAILSKPESEKTEEDKVFALMDKAKGVKVKKTGIVDMRGNDILSEEI